MVQHGATKTENYENPLTSFYRSKHGSHKDKICLLCGVDTKIPGKEWSTHCKRVHEKSARDTVQGDDWEYAPGDREGNIEIMKKFFGKRFVEQDIARVRQQEREVTEKKRIAAEKKKIQEELAITHPKLLAEKEKIEELMRQLKEEK